MGKTNRSKAAGAKKPAEKKARSASPEPSGSAAGAKEPAGETARSPTPELAPPPPTQLGSYADAASGAHSGASAGASVPVPPSNDQMDTSRAASPSGEPTNTTSADLEWGSGADQAQENQSKGKAKASSGPKGTKRRLPAPDWSLGQSMYRVKEWASYMRPPP
jgi:hypothetical protein